MKPFRYQNKDSVFKTADIGYKLKRRFSWDRFFFLTVIVGITGWLLSISFTSIFFVEGRGQVVFDYREVSLLSDIYLDSLYVQDGDSISKGTPLFRYTHLDIDNLPSTQIKRVEREERRQKEIRDVSRDLRLKNQQIYGQRLLVNEINSQYQKYSDLLVLNAVTVKDYENVKKQKIVAENQLNMYYFERNNLTSELSSLERNQDLYSGLTNGYLNFDAPIAGQVSMQLFSDNQSVSKSTPIMRILNSKDVMVHGFFEMKYIEEVQPNRQVRVSFPNGEYTTGYIRRVFLSTSESPKEFQKKYEPTNRYIVAEISPSNLEDKDLWTKYDKLLLNLRIMK